MRFNDDSLYPENMLPLIITAAPYGPSWLPGDTTDIAVTWDEQVQAAVGPHVPELVDAGEDRRTLAVARQGSDTERHARQLTFPCGQ